MSKSKEPWRWGIVWLFTAALVPGFLSACAMFYFLYDDEVEKLEVSALQTARALTLAVDRDLASMRGRLETLATAPSLLAGNIDAFYRQAQQALAAEQLGDAVVLIDAAGQMTLNTLRPLGATLPMTGHPSLLQETFAGTRLVVSDLYIENASKRPYVTLEVPVVRDGTVIYALDMAVSSERLSRMLAGQALPEGWVATLLDKQGTVVARSLHAEAMVGRHATGDLVSAMAKSTEGRFPSRTLEGTPSFVAFNTSAHSGWTVAVAMSRSVLYANLYRPLALAALTIIVFWLGSAMIVLAVSRHFRRALRSLEGAVSAASKGDLQVAARVSGAREIARVSEQFNMMQQARRDADTRVRLATDVFSGAVEGIIIVDRHGDIVDVNQAFTTLTGYRREDALGRNPRAFWQRGIESPGFLRGMMQAIERDGFWRGNLQHLRKDGDPFTARMTARAVKSREGRVDHYVASFYDVTEAERQREEIERQAFFDSLTQLPNRRLLSDRLQQVLARADRTKTVVAVAYLDLDGFKPVNDRHGHKAGDLVLVEVAQRLTHALRAHDTVARVGGDEFVLLMSGLADEQGATAILNRVMDKLREPISMQGSGHVVIHASIGVAFYPRNAGSAESLLRSADMAMYEAKAAGRNQVKLFQAGLASEPREPHVP